MKALTTRSRSNEQNSLLWSLLTQISEQVIWDSERLSKEDWKDMLTASLQGYRSARAIDAGKRVVFGMRTSNMTVEQMGDLIELAYAFGAQEGVRFKENEPFGS